MAVIAMLALLSAGPSAQESLTMTPITDAEIVHALTVVRSDPNWGGQRTMKMLRWRDTNRQSAPNLSWLGWVTDFFAWLMQSARYALWVGLALLAAWLGAYIWRALRTRRLTTTAEGEAFVPPTHVRDLDIRPESLPSNIGAAARLLWERGDRRSALSLLYRGLLSRLTHVHRIPIVDSSTEGDCLLLVAGRAPQRTIEYAARLVEAWRIYVYGGTDTPASEAYALCDGFGDALDRTGEPTSKGGDR